MSHASHRRSVSSQQVLKGWKSVESVLQATLGLKKSNQDRLEFPESNLQLFLLSFSLFLPGWGRAALFVSVYHAVARGHCQEHLQAGDQETSTEPRW